MSVNSAPNPPVIRTIVAEGQITASTLWTVPDGGYDRYYLAYQNLFGTVGNVTVVDVSEHGTEHYVAFPATLNHQARKLKGISTPPYIILVIGTDAGLFAHVHGGTLPALPNPFPIAHGSEVENPYEFP